MIKHILKPRLCSNEFYSCGAANLLVYLPPLPLLGLTPRLRNGIVRPSTGESRAHFSVQKRDRIERTIPLISY
ncbi:hypothetical protein CEXT_725351 [Caerostris extrusa]|uniref:Ycf15 n=1 Tax=Caerostris extrusa TaxID=172846 RepID=A0AAV4NR52_CAEEX|nr:hypothetical protein CEXT_725351 [Caerostris extrusa]